MKLAEVVLSLELDAKEGDLGQAQALIPRLEE